MPCIFFYHSTCNTTTHSLFTCLSLPMWKNPLESKGYKQTMLMPGPVPLCWLWDPLQLQLTAVVHPDTFLAQVLCWSTLLPKGFLLCHGNLLCTEVEQLRNAKDVMLLGQTSTNEGQKSVGKCSWPLIGQFWGVFYVVPKRIPRGNESQLSTWWPTHECTLYWL